MTSVLFTDFGALSSLSAHGAYCLATDPGRPAFVYTYNATSPLIAPFAVFARQPCGFAPYAAVHTRLRATSLNSDSRAVSGRAGRRCCRIAVRLLYCCQWGLDNA